MKVSKTPMFTFIAAIVCFTVAAQASQVQASDLQSVRNWLADTIRGGDSESDGGATLPQSNTLAIPAQIQENSRGLAADISAILNARIGWLIPRTTKELALLWLVVAVSLPWLFTSTLRAMLRFEEIAIGYLVTIVWSGSIVWLGWHLWGAASGADRFVSSLMILLPVLMVYFLGIVRALGPECPNSQSGNR